MSDSKTVLKGLVLVAVVVAIGIGIGVWGSKGPRVEPVADGPGAPGATTAAEPTAIDTRPRSPSVPPAAPERDNAGMLPGPSPATAAVPAGATITNWEDRVDEILGDEQMSESAKATQMLEMFPRLPEDGQVEVAQHLSNLVTDEEYAPLAAYLKSPGLPEPVLDVLISDVLNRPNETKLPLLLDIARADQHPKAEEALDLLQLFLEEDYGQDWAKWQERMQQWLQDNPD